MFWRWFKTYFREELLKGSKQESNSSIIVIRPFLFVIWTAAPIRRPISIPFWCAGHAVGFVYRFDTVRRYTPTTLRMSIL
jgi:hypothetical protein